MSSSLLFTGHMIDLPDRKQPRFPPELEEPARRRIGVEIDRAKASEGLLAFASGARGGDILFHEECRAREIATMIVLPFSPEDFIRTSVEGVSSGDWRRRFWNLWNATPGTHRIVLGEPVSDEAYAACNAKLLDLARRHGRMHLIALWDGSGGDGPGGTADMVAQAKGARDLPTIFSPKDLAAEEISGTRRAATARAR